MTLQIKLICVLAAVALVASAVFFIYKQGNDNALSGVERQNSKAASVGQEAAMSYTDCRKRDGVYQFDTGKCRFVTPGNR